MTASAPDQTTPAPAGNATTEDEPPSVAFPDNPVLAAITRDPGIESHHRGAVIVLDAAGAVRLAWGDVERPVFPRSALKPIQALALLEALPDPGALSDERVALHTASHSGWPAHTDRVAAWLADLGLSTDALSCGAGDWPMDPAAARALAATGARPSALHHNCSGQHTGFLMLAGLMGVSPRGYASADHPVQRAVTAVIADMTDVAPDSLPWGVEGCGVPSPAMPLWAVALGMARLADPSGLSPGRAAAATRLRRAMAAHPDLVAGPGRCDTRVASATGGRVLTKIGAEGNVVALIPDAGLGLALKIDDGAGRGAELALGSVLDALSLLQDSERAALADLFQPTVTNAAGRIVGRGLPVRPAEADSDDADDGDPWDWDDDDTDDHA
ncbi:asparaginase [Roseospira visakhapatnamensis]|uniref:L-asparaginase II n=1 Tax=Roseospira visakhapatnamensis TaxID=390880 RepID=A0A7W6RBT2_9PROT|nr:asparaginase [Roseospira visakhapatnamensis]MBB4265552.1 L-asparaginase II [Roseospira visakhapatnamensis]